MDSNPIILLLVPQAEERQRLSSALLSAGFSIVESRDMAKAMDILRTLPVGLIVSSPLHDTPLRRIFLRVIAKLYGGTGIALTKESPEMEDALCQAGIPYGFLPGGRVSSEEFAGHLSGMIHANASLGSARRKEFVRMFSAEEVTEGIWFLDLEKPELRWNSRVDRILGFEPGEMEPSVDWCCERIHPEDLAKARETAGKYLSGEIFEHELEYRVRVKSGNWVWLWDCGYAEAFSSSGRPLRLTGWVRDITSRKDAEMVLRRREREFRDLFELHPDALVLLDHPSHVILRGNAAFCNLTGYEPEETAGKMLAEITHPLDIDAEMREMGRVLEEFGGGTATYSKRLIRRDGVAVPVSVTTKFYRGENQEVLFCLQIARPAAVRRAASSAIRREFHKQFLEVMPMPVWITDAEDRLVFTNPRARELAETPAALPDGSPFPLALLFGDASQSPRFQDWCRQARETMQPTRYEDMAVSTPSGRALRFSGWLIPLAGTAGAYDGMIIAAGEAAGGAGREAREELEAKLRARTEDLAAMNAQFARELEISKTLQHQLIQADRLAATGLIASSIAHEINSPLQAMAFTLKSIESDAEKADDRKLQDEIGIVRAAFEHIRDTVKNLLDLNRPGKAQFQNANINEVIQNTLNIARGLLKSHGVQLETHFSERIPPRKISPQGISQVCLNMINNACEAMSRHEGKKILSVKTRESQGVIHVIFADTGPGIPPEDIPRVFDPFFTNKKKMGMGVGLSISLNIVREHGGQITVRNRRDGGAVFTIRLPEERAAPL